MDSAKRVLANLSPWSTAAIQRGTEYVNQRNAAGQAVRHLQS